MASASAENMLQWLHTMDVDVNIFDTDCFGVMWHGSYTKWMEIGRVKLFESQGVFLSKPGERAGYVYPVIEQNFKFRSSAPYGDKLLMTTRLAVEGYKLQFYQTFRSQNTDKITVEAVTTVVVVDADWKLQRRLPDSLVRILGV